MYYSKLVDKFYEGCYGGWNYPTRGQRIIVNGTKELAPLLWVKRVPDEDPREPVLANALGGQFRAPKLVVRALSESVVKDVKARNSELPGPSTSGSSRTSTSRTTNNKRIRAEESMVTERKKLKRSCTSRSSVSSDIVNLSDDDSSKQEESSDPENTPLKDVRNTKISTNLCLQINFVFKYTFLLHLAEER
jgi:hypothetical protein